MRETARPSETSAVPATERDSPDAAEKATQAALAAQTEIDDLRWLMAAKQGRRFIWRLLGESGLYRPSYVPGATDAMAVAYHEGARNTGLKLLGLITEHCPERLSEMQKEARTHDRRQGKPQS